MIWIFQFSVFISVVIDTQGIISAEGPAGSQLKFELRCGLPARQTSAFREHPQIMTLYRFPSPETKFLKCLVP